MYHLQLLHKIMLLEQLVRFDSEPSDGEADFDVRELYRLKRQTLTGA